MARSLEGLNIFQGFFVESIVIGNVGFRITLFGVLSELA